MQDKIRRLTPKEVEALGRWLKAEMGIDISIYKEDFIGRRYLPRAGALGFSGIEDYLDSLRTNEKEKHIARKRLLVGTTELFRNREIFESLGRLVGSSPALAGAERLIALSAPCSTGEEALSMAVVLSQVSAAWTVLAMERNLSALRQVKRQRFSKKSLSRLDKNEIKHYLKDEGNWFSFKEELLDSIVPVCCDLVMPLPVKRAHIVFMRNFFIYLNEEAQKAAIENVRNVLVKGGLLVLGKVERPRLSSDEWEKADVESGIFFLKGGAK